jgi:hypothetical protein
VSHHPSAREMRGRLRCGRRDGRVTRGHFQVAVVRTAGVPVVKGPGRPGCFAIRGRKARRTAIRSDHGDGQGRLHRILPANAGPFATNAARRRTFTTSPRQAPTVASIRLMRAKPCQDSNRHRRDRHRRDRRTPSWTVSTSGNVKVDRLMASYGGAKRAHPVPALTFDPLRR